MTQLSQTTTVPAPRREYDGYAPIHHCVCGCGVVIGDGDWAHGKRHHRATLPRQLRYRAGSALFSPRR